MGQSQIDHRSCKYTERFPDGWLGFAFELVLVEASHRIKEISVTIGIRTSTKHLKARSHEGDLDSTLTFLKMAKIREKHTLNLVLATVHTIIHLY